MNHFQQQTKKKPLIQYQKMKYNQQTIIAKDKVKKDKSIQKQNQYEQQNKKFKDFNQKYSTAYNGNEIDTFKKQNIYPTVLTPSSLQEKMLLNNASSSHTNHQQANNKASSGLGSTTVNQKSNLTFGLVKTTQISQINQLVQHNNHNQNNQNNQNNPSKIYLNHPNDLQNRMSSVNTLNTQNQKQNTIQYTKFSKYQIKPLGNFQKKNHQTINAKTNYQNINTKNNYNRDHQQKRKVLGNLNINTQNIQPPTTDRYLQRTNMIDRANGDKNDRPDRKQKFKAKYPIPHNLSPIDKQFLCEEQLQIRPNDKRLYEKKLSQKKLQGPLIANSNGPVLMQRFPAKKVDKKAQQLKQLKQFQTQQQDINSCGCSQSITVLFAQQDQYIVNPTYLQKSQKLITWSVRAILIDWMRQLSHQYALKRDTYHLAVVLLDNYLAKKPHVQKQIAQVIGATTLFIASKLEELQCRPSQSFAQSTQGISTAKDIQTWEFQICKTLQFKLNPPTICSLANRIMAQWDKYIDQVYYAMHHLCFEGKQKVYFKRLDQSSYKQFRQMMQYIDCLILDIQTVQFKPILIILSLMYLMIGTKVGGFSYQQIHQSFPRSSQYLLERSNYFNDLFENFVQSTFGLALIEILPTVQYAASYFNLNLTYEKPILGDNQEQVEQMDLEEYCSYQTYNRHMLKTVTTRFRGILNAF